MGKVDSQTYLKFLRNIYKIIVAIILFSFSYFTEGQNIIGSTEETELEEYDLIKKGEILRNQKLT
ncbi:hypothetical protein, partial [Mesonia sp. K7]|uniref:hypothetical protein n=1 Tax=Mesonia sp. K7 TaxID=2218606 RepID=UPI000DB13300